MNRVFTLLILFLVAQNLYSQDGINQVIVANGGQFGNPLEQTNLAAYDPISMDYNVFDTLPVNSVQHIIIDGDFLYVAAQSVIAKYDLDSYERLALVDFPGVGAHQLALYQDKLFATNSYGQTSDNLYVFDANTLTLLDTVQEITSPWGTMVIANNKLFIGQNLQGNTDACPPFGCFNDTLGFIAEVDLISNQLIQNIAVNNNGMETGRLVTDGFNVYCLNEVSNSVTTYNISSGQSNTQIINADIRTSRYRNEVHVINGKIIAPFNDGIGALSVDLDTIIPVLDTLVTAFAFDYLNDIFYITATNFFSYINGYAFSGAGEYLYDFPVGFAPEAIAIHYNNAPIGMSYSTESQANIIVPIGEIASDPDDDNLAAVSLQDAPANGVVSFLPNGDINYNSLSPGSSDAFRVKVCDDKLNALCNFVQVNITSTTAVHDNLFQGVQIYPNPVSSELFIKNEVSGSEYILYNPLGEVIKTYYNSERILLENLPTGNYFLKMIKDQDSRTVHFYKH